MFGRFRIWSGHSRMEFGNLQNRINFYSFGTLTICRFIRVMKQSVSKEDFFILQRMIEGDENAFKYFFDTYYDDLCNFANGYLRDEALSEETIQDIFVYFWEKKDSLQLKGSVKSYLFAASKNKSLNYLRDLKNQNRIIGELIPITELTTGSAD